MGSCCISPTLRTITLLYLSVTLLAGCGGSGNTNTGSTPQGVTLSGSVVKGIIRHGLVDVYPITAGTPADTPIMTGTTGVDGRYTLTVPAGQTGPFKLVLRKGPATEMRCDAPAGCGITPYGEWIPTSALPANLSLQAMLPAQTAGSSTAVNITPLTHMASVDAARRGLDSDNIRIANQRVGTLFEITDIVGQEPIDIVDSAAITSASPDRVRLALFSAALAQQAYGTHRDLAEAIEALASGYASHQGQLATQPAAGEMSLSELVEGAEAVVAQIRTSAPAALDTQVAMTVAELATLAKASDYTAIPEVETPPPSNDFDAAKALVRAIRDYWKGLLDPTSATSQARLTLDHQVAQSRQVVADAESALPHYLDLLSAATRFALAPTSSSEPTCTSGYDLDQIDAIQALEPGLHGCLEVSGSEQALLSGTPFTLRFVAYLGTEGEPRYRFDANVTPEGALQAVGISFSGAINHPEAFRLALDNSTLTLAVDRTLNADNLSEAQLRASDADLSVALESLDPLAPFSFSGTLTLDSLWQQAQQLSDCPTCPSDTAYLPLPRSLALSGKVTYPGGEYGLSANGIISNADSYQISAPLMPGHQVSGSYQFNADGTELTLTLLQRRTRLRLDSATGEGWLAHDAFTADGWVEQNLYRLNRDIGTGTLPTYASMRELLEDNHWRLLDYLTAWVDNQGLYFAAFAADGPIQLSEESLQLPASLAGQSGALIATLETPSWWLGRFDHYYQSSSNYLLADLTLRLDLSLPELPALALTLSGKTQGPYAGIGSALVNHANNRLSLTASGDAGSALINLSALDQNGSRLLITTASGATSGQLSVNGVIYGSIQEESGILLIRYTDGTFESLD